MISKEKALIEAEALKNKLEIEKKEETKLRSYNEKCQRDSVKKMFFDKFNEWYIRYLAGLKDYSIKHRHIQFGSTDVLRVYFKSVIKEELLSHNDALKSRGFKIRDIDVDTHYITVYLRDVNSFSCGVM